jgi:hypothetical protein
MMQPAQRTDVLRGVVSTGSPALDVGCFGLQVAAVNAALLTSDGLQQLFVNHPATL